MLQQLQHGQTKLICCSFLRTDSLQMDNIRTHKSTDYRICVSNIYCK